MFAPCRTCAENLQQTPCEHSDSERTLSGTKPSSEIQKACELGYRVVKLIEVWNFQDRSADLFKGYIGTFLKIKQEASGWPLWCRTGADKHQYVREYQGKEGIKLDPEKIKKNPGLRSLAKLSLNSFCNQHLLAN